MLVYEINKIFRNHFQTVKTILTRCEIIKCHFIFWHFEGGNLVGKFHSFYRVLWKFSLISITLEYFSKVDVARFMYVGNGYFGAAFYWRYSTISYITIYVSEQSHYQVQQKQMLTGHLSVHHFVNFINVMLLTTYMWRWYKSFILYMKSCIRS